MAESKSKSKSRRSSSKGRSQGSSSKSRSQSSGSKSRSQRSSSSPSRSDSERPVREIVGEAMGQVQELIGRPVESVTGVERNGNEWTVMLEVLELERIPNTTDVLGVYEITINKDGELTSAHRRRRYYRSEAGED